MLHCLRKKFYRGRMKKGQAQGSVLVLAMMFVALISLIGIGLLEQSFLELKMTHLFHENILKLKNSGASAP